MQLEECGRGSVPWSVYGVYIKASGGALAFLLILALFVLNVGSMAFSNWWLSYWIKQGSGVSDDRDGAGTDSTLPKCCVTARCHESRHKR